MPNHPEYPSAHGFVTGAVATLIESYFGTRAVHIEADSRVFTDGIHTHVFEDTRDLVIRRSAWWNSQSRLRLSLN